VRACLQQSGITGVLDAGDQPESAGVRNGGTVRQDEAQIGRIAVSVEEGEVSFGLSQSACCCEFGAVHDVQE
jgi:hypothetical protein